RRRVTDERELRIPLEYGWQRETRIRNFGGRLQGEVAYYAPCGKKLRQYPEVIKYLSRNGIMDISRDNFSFSAKIRVGDFYEARDGPQGMQWCLLKEEDVIPRIRAMEGRRGRPPNPDRQRVREESRMRRRKGRPPNVGSAEFLDNTDAKLLRKLQAEAIMAAEEKRKQKEQIKIMKQQALGSPSLKTIMQAQAKKKKKEEAANAKLLEAEKRIKVREKEMRRQQAVLLKHQVKTEVGDKVEKESKEKERLKQEKRDEKRLNKERKLEQRRLELEMAKELKKPNEDMCLADQKQPLPELPRIPGLVLSGSTFSDCLMVVQFLRNFGKVLGFDVNIDVPNLSVLQEGLLNIGDSMGEVQDLLVRLLSAAVCDPGLITGYKAKTALGEHLLNVGVNRDNVSEILQIFMEAHCGQTELTESLKTKAFQAHTPEQKASVLAFLINELACSKSVVSEIDKNIDYMSNLRRDKWVVEGKLRKLRIIHAKKTGKRDASEEDKEDKKGKKTDICEDEAKVQSQDEEQNYKAGRSNKFQKEDEGDQAASVEELEKQIEKLSKQQSQYRRKLFDASHSLRSMMFGQDRYRRRYWILPQCGGIFVEGMESGEATVSDIKYYSFADSISVTLTSTISSIKRNVQKEKTNSKSSIEPKRQKGPHEPDFVGLEEIAKEREKLKKAESIQIKEEMFETPGDTLNCLNTDHCEQKEDLKEKDNTNLFLQKPGSFSKLNSMTPKPNGSANGCTSSSQNSGKHSLGSLQSTATQSNVEKTDSNTLFSPGSSGPGKFYSPLPSDQLPQPPPKSPSPAPAPLLGSSSSQNPIGLNPFALSPLQVSTALTPQRFSFKVESVDSKSESPVPQNEKVSSTQPAAVEVAKPVDFLSPKPIPEEMQFGWWRIIDPEDLKALLKVLHLRGIREKALQKQIQKHLDYISQACIKNKDELNENEENQVTRDIVENWSVEEQAMEMDLSILQQVEDLERRVASASLQVKGWMCPEPASEREDLVYFEHKSFTKLCKEHDGEFTGEEESSAHALERKSDNPLDIAVTRLADLERNIERRYLKSPLSTTIQIKLDNVGTVTVPAPAPSISGDGDGIEEDIAPGLRVWRRALSEARSAAQVALCIQQLQKSIAWEKSIMKVYCQICRKGDNEELLLLCDGCDKGCHTYCHRPKITTIPDGDWFCPACIAKKYTNVREMHPGMCNLKKKIKSIRFALYYAKTNSQRSFEKASGQTLKIKKLHVKGKKINEPKKVKKPKRDDSKDLALCSMILTEMETHEDAWPFLLPVNLKLVPGYKKVIKKPMDFSTIREKLSSGQYPNLETFALDVRLVFDNCETFNEDDSDIGRAGHSMRKYFEKKWTDTFKNREAHP
uniref:Bromodomain adjacent to zinc finger domain protein 2B n=1 Tax=Loxodonta africana TaxID=9785 RepID=G3U3C2_LOXAF